MTSSYLQIGIDDYECIQILMNSGKFNNAMVLCQQACEKFLKSVIELVVPECKNLLHSHNLKKLFDEIEGIISMPEEMIYYLGTLSDFYIDVRYPGDNYVKVKERDIVMAVKIADHLYTEVVSWHSKFDNKKTDKFEELMRSVELVNK